MEKNAKTILALLIVLAVVLLMTLGLGIRIGATMTEQPEPTVVRDTIRTTDTIQLPAPPPDTVTKTITKVVQVPLTDVEVDTDVDSARITLPFEQHHAQLGDVADVWYSGYDAKIDSATIYKHQQTVIEQHYITQPAPSNIIGLEAGAKDASLLYIHRFGKVHVGFSAGSTYEGQPTARGFIGIQF
jgi:hypothetical protein